MPNPRPPFARTNKKVIKRNEDVRKKIQTGVLLQRLNDYAATDFSSKGAQRSKMMLDGQIKAASILLKKVVPDLTSTTLSGDPNAPLQGEVSIKLDAATLNAITDAIKKSL